MNKLIEHIVRGTVLDMARRLEELIEAGFDYDDRQAQYKKDFGYILWDCAFYQADTESMLILYTEKVCPVFR